MVGSTVGGSRARACGMTAALLVWGFGCADAAMDEMPSTGVPVAGSFGAAGTAPGPGGAGGVGVLPAAGTGSFAGAGVAGSAGIGGGSGMTGGIAGGAAGMAAGTSGQGGAGGMAAGAGAGAGGGGGGGGSVSLPTGPEPTLPAIQGECPQLMNGTTIMVAGHGGVAIAAGEAGKGGALLFYWHGTGGSAMEAMRSLPAGVRDEIISGGGIIAAFNGNDSSGAEGDCSGTAAHNIADFKAADQIAACAARDHGIDPRRIYTTGCSAGGLQSGCMAQMRSSYIAASAPNSGGVVSSRPWQDDHSPAIFTMHGGSSDMVIVTFSTTSRTLDMAAKTHGSFVVNCNHGGGHCAAPADLKTAAWQFMKDHPWGFTESPWMTAFPAGVPDYCMVF